MPIITQPLPRNTIGDLIRKIKTNYGEVMAVFLFGSIAEGTWTDSSDLDVGVIIDSAEGVDKRPTPFVLNGVPVELHVHASNSFEKAEVVASATLSSHIMNSITIYDPTNFFNSVKSKTAEIYFTKPFIQNRVYNCLDIAHDYIQNAERFLSEGKLEFVPGSIHRATNSGIAMALFYSKKSNPTQRRCLSKLESILTDPEEQIIYYKIVDLVNLNEATSELATKAIVHGKKFHAALSHDLKRRRGPLWEKNKHWYNAIIRSYIIEGAKMLLQEKKYPASIFCTMMLANSPEIYDQIMPHFAKKHQEEVLFLLRGIFLFEEIQKPKIHKKIQEARSIMNSIRILQLGSS